MWPMERSMSPKNKLCLQKYLAFKLAFLVCSTSIRYVYSSSEIQLIIWIRRTDTRTFKELQIVQIARHAGLKIE